MHLTVSFSLCGGDTTSDRGEGASNLNLSSHTITTDIWCVIDEEEPCVFSHCESTQLIEYTLC